MKKIIIFHPTIAPYRIDFFNDLYRAFDTEIYLYYENLKNQTLDYEQIKKKFVFTPHYMKEWFSIGERAVYKGHIREILRQKPDIVIVGEYSIGVWCAVIARVLSRKKFKIVTICDDSVKIAKECTGGRRKSRDLLIQKLDGILLGNEPVQKWYRQYCNVPSFVFPIIHRDEVFREELTESLDIADNLIDQYQLQGKRVFLFVGRLVKEKNVAYLVRSFIEEYKNNKDMVLLVVGDSGSSDGIEEKRCRELIHEKDATDYIFMVGHKEGKELLAFFAVAQVLILPSIYEPFGAVVNEALLAGMYVMVSSNAGASSLVTPENGEIINIERSSIDFSSILERIEPVGKQIKPRKNRMPYSYDRKMNDLIQWLTELDA